MDSATVIGPGFAVIPDRLLYEQAVSDRALRLWLLLSRYAGLRLGAVPRRRELARMLGTSEKSVLRATNELVHVGWIAVLRRAKAGGAFVYVDAAMERGEGGAFVSGSGLDYTSNHYVVFNSPLTPDAAAEAIAQAYPEASPEAIASPQDAHAQAQDPRTLVTGAADTGDRGAADTSVREERHTLRDPHLAPPGGPEGIAEPPPLAALGGAQAETLRHLHAAIEGAGIRVPHDRWGVSHVMRGLTAADVDRAAAESQGIPRPQWLAHFTQVIERAAQERAAGRSPWPAAALGGWRQGQRPTPRLVDLNAGERARRPDRTVA